MLGRHLITNRMYYPTFAIINLASSIPDFAMLNPSYLLLAVSRGYLVDANGLSPQLTESPFSLR